MKRRVFVGDVRWSVTHGWACVTCFDVNRYCQHFPRWWGSAGLFGLRKVHLPFGYAGRISKHAGVRWLPAHRRWT